MRKLVHFVLSLFRVCIKTSNDTIPSRAKPSLPDGLCRQFSLHEIKTATRDFDRSLIIGRGGGGTVYKGLIDKGSLLVAVKVLKASLSSQGGFEEFENELLLLCQLRHHHLVSLVGFCHEKDEMILVYNYMSNGSLHDYLHGNGAHDPLTWKQRLGICIGAARGLHYLHTGAKRAVIHRDIKSKNILLDGLLVPRLSDFGMSKIGPFSLSNAPLRIKLTSLDDQTSTTMGGTLGYMDPELFVDCTQVTDKSDVYSFGVVLFELLCGRKVLKRDVEEEDQQHLIRWVNKCLKNGTIYHTIDPYLKGKIAPSCLEKFLEIAFSCIQVKGSKRPALGEVQETLEVALELQCKADAEIECINPYGEISIYEEVIFSPSAFHDVTTNMFESHASFSVDSFKTTADSTSAFDVSINIVEQHGSFSGDSIKTEHGSFSGDSIKTEDTILSDIDMRYICNIEDMIIT